MLKLIDEILTTEQCCFIKFQNLTTTMITLIITVYTGTQLQSSSTAIKKKCLQIKVIHSCSPSLSISPSFTQMYTKQLMPLAKLCNNYSCCSKYWIHTSVYVDQCLPQCITASDSFVVGGRRGLIAHGWPMCPWPRRSIPICLTTP